MLSDNSLQTHLTHHTNNMNNAQRLNLAVDADMRLTTAIARKCANDITLEDAITINDDYVPEVDDDNDYPPPQTSLSLEQFLDKAKALFIKKRASSLDTKESMIQSTK